jgi:uncharacterized protein YcgL (UPF0745 family)
MPNYAIHRSREYPNRYLITRNRNDFQTVPPEALDSLGEVDFIKETHDLSEDNLDLGAGLDQVQREVEEKGYFMQPGKTSDAP